MTSSSVATAPRFSRLHGWLLVTTCLASAGFAACFVLDWRPMWAVPAGPFAGWLHRGSFTGWSRGVGAFTLALLPWASGALAVGVAAQWLVPLRGRSASVARHGLWAAGWAAWFWCGVLSCLNTYG